MGKIYTRKILFVIAAMLLCILVAILIRLFFSSRTVRMTLTPIEVETGETVHYADSTRNARSWLWEFGNGDISHERSGEYVFKKPTLPSAPSSGRRTGKETDHHSTQEPG